MMVGAYLLYLVATAGAAGPLDRAWKFELEGNYREAVRWYLRAYEEVPERRAIYGLVRTCFRTGKYDVLVPILKGYLLTHPQDSEVGLWLGEALYRTGDTTGALGAWEKLIGTPSEGRALVRAAEILFEGGKYGKLISLVRPRFTSCRAPEGARLALILGDAYVRTDSLKEAEAIYRKIAEEAPTYADSANFLLGKVLFWEGKVEEARRAWEKVAGNPSAPLADEAIGCLLRLDEGPEDALRAFALGMLRLEQGRMDDALAELNAPELSSSSLYDEAVLFKAKIYLKQGDTLKATSELRSLAFSRRRLAPEAMFKLGEILKGEEAVEAYEEFLRRYPDDVRVQEVRRRLREMLNGREGHGR
ncbi:MAG TPA: tetratricopeptide repeat protein [Candidatus Latescibacteria bacterium]|nr:tetratricopeptide repeat protein [Candidatus Latescibacterota bacterium]